MVNSSSKCNQCIFHKKRKVKQNFVSIGQIEEKNVQKSFFGDFRVYIRFFQKYEDDLSLIRR